MTDHLLLDFGDHAQGLAIDDDLWALESRVRAVRPERVAAGEVRAVFPYAPHIAMVLTSTGDLVTIRVQR
jgi:hypothetical protein